MATTPQYNFNVNRQDLDFILKQIKIAEVSTLPNGQIDGAALRNAVGGVGAQASAAALLPYGLRTVDGTWNNLLPGQERLGAADNLMPRYVPIQLRAAEAGDPDGPGPAPLAPTSYAQNSGLVFDSQPRIITNLIVDQTANNPAAVQADLERDGVLGDHPPIVNIPGPGVPAGSSFMIPNLSPDIGLSPPFNSWMTFFGQFFDHGLDLIDKGSSGTVFIPLQPDDPLFVVGSPTNFMVLTRATNQPGLDGIVGTADDIHDHRNTTTPFVDQNQTYTSHPSHQVFLREYARVADDTVGTPDAGTALDVVATGRLLRHQVTTGLVTTTTGEGTWGDVKAQAASMLGVRLQDTDVFDCPLLATDRYGEFIRGANGFVQIVTATGLVEGDPTANGGQGVFLPANTIRTGHAFLNDIAHNAAPNTFDHDNNPATPKIQKTADLDTAVSVFGVGVQPTGTYDNELLERHFITGDGRGNENIGLTAVHTVFHSEHNRLVGDNKSTIIGSGDLAFANEWLRQPLSVANTAVFNAIPVAPGVLRDNAIDSLVRSLDATNSWDGERLFQAGRFVTEMQYQHLVFEEFARGVSPTIDPFIFSNSSDINPAIFAEFANVVYRFGHSMLTENVGRLAADGQTSSDLGLIQAFLNPLAFNNDHSLSEAEAVGRIVRGNTRIVGNEIDEFIVEALRNNLVGLPLDLGVLNIARARDTGMPSFNEARAQFFAMTGDAQLAPFTSWADMAGHLKHSASIINFIAAYGQHASILAEATTDGKRAAANALVMGVPFTGVIDTTAVEGSGASRTFAVPADRVDFLNSTGTWNAGNSGLNKVDFWIGGLAEFVNEFQGMLGPTFNFVFETQMENLQNGDRFYYLSRTQGTNMIHQLENNTFSKLIMRNSDLGQDTTHLPSLVFTTPNWYLEVNQARQNNAALANGPGRDGILGTLDDTTANSDPFGDDPILEAINPMVQRGPNFISFAGGEHVVLGGSVGNDTLRGGKGIDSLWGDDGNDRLDGGDEADQVNGGDGDDIITDHGTPAGGIDFLRGDNGDDVISAGTGNDLVFGGLGQDFIILGNDFSEVFAGEGNDFILGGNGPDVLLGNEGNDWIEGGEGLDNLSGENSELFFNSPIIGHDVLNGQGNDADYDGESGDDIMVNGPGIQRNNGMLGFDWGIHKGDPVPADSDLGIPFFPAQTVFTLRDRFDSVEGLSGWNLDDKLTGVSFPLGAVGAGVGIIGAPATDSKLLAQNVDLISGFRALLGLPAAGALGAANTVPQVVVPGLGALPVDVIDPNTGGDIIIGGGGSDIINGKAGNDIIDGNAWLNVRVAFAVSAVTGTGPVPFALDAQGRYTVDSIKTLTPFMLAGRIDPGALQIVREIVTAPDREAGPDRILGNADDVFTNDVALYAGAGGVFVNNVGAASTTLGVAAGSTLTGVGFAITRVTAGAGGLITVTDTDIGTLPSVLGVPVGDPLLRNEGTDRLRNMEIARFTNTDGTFTDITLNGVIVNALPTGGLAISDITPTQGQTLTVASTIADANGLGALSFQWQALVGGTTWTNVQGLAPVVGTNASLVLNDIVSEPLVGLPLRVVASYTDGGGTLETVTSAATDVLGNLFTNLLPVNITVNGTAGADNLIGNGAVDTFNGLGGDDVLTGGLGADILNGGLGNDTLVGNGGADQLTGGAGLDTMTGSGGADTFFFLATTETGNALGARDIITDFVSASDRINLAAIDANTLLAGDQAFVPTALGGTGAFTGVAGQLRGFVEGTNIIIAGDTNGDGISDFQIQLNNALTIVPADFVL